MKLYFHTVLAGMASFISLIICYSFNVNLMFFSVFTVIVLTHLFMDRLHIKAIERFVGSLIGVFLMSLNLYFFKNYPIIVYSIASLLVLVFLYGFIKDFFAYGMLFSALTLCFMGAYFFLKGEAASFNIGFYWLLNVFIGALITIIMLELARFFWTKSPHHITPFKEQIQLPNHSKHFFKSVDWKNLFKVIFVIFGLFIVFPINEELSLSSLSLQAMIAALVVSLQTETGISLQKALHRIRGVFMGSLTALFFVELFYLIHYSPSAPLVFVVVSICVMVFTFLGGKLQRKDYLYLQAALMIPLILLPEQELISFNVQFARERGLGSLEGALIGLMVVWFFNLFLLILKRNTKTSKIALY